MSVKVTIVDYGVGNLYSVRAALEHCGAEVELATDAGKVESADRLLLPGVGAFEDATADMRDCALIEPVLEFARNGRPLMGICLGMQMLFDQSEEFGTHKGLGLIPGAVLPIPETDRNGAPHCIPHVGWDEIEAAAGADWSAGLLKGIEPGTSVYYSHSFRALPADSAHRVADCDYGGHAIASVVMSGNIHGCQFHPEKSGEAGLSILRNYLAL